MKKQTNIRIFALELRKAFASKDSHYQNGTGELFVLLLFECHPQGEGQEEQLNLCSGSLLSSGETDFLLSAKITSKRYPVHHASRFRSIL